MLHPAAANSLPGTEIQLVFNCQSLQMGPQAPFRAHAGAIPSKAEQEPVWGWKQQHPPGPPGGTSIPINLFQVWFCSSNN